MESALPENPYESPPLVKPEEDSLPRKQTLVQLLLHPANFLLPIAATLQFTILINESVPTAFVLVGFTLFAGVLGHFLYERIINKRWVVHFAVLSLFSLGLGTLALQDGSFSHVLEVPFLIPSAIRWSNPTAATTMTVGMMLVLAIVSAHSIRPGFRTALLTALGWGIWYSASLMILSHAG